MNRPLRGLGPRTDASSRRWPLFLGLVVIATVSTGGLWLRGERLRAVAELQARLALRVERIEGLLWPTRLTNVASYLSPNLSVRVASVELGAVPWRRTSRAYGVVVRAHAPLDTIWEEARSVVLPANVQVMDTRLEYTAPSGGKLSAEGMTLKRGQLEDHLHVQSLHAFGTTFRDVHSWWSRPSTALEIRLARDADDAKAPMLRASRSAGEGVEWSLDIPSQPFASLADRLALNVDETWSGAVVVGIGSVVIPDATTSPARAHLRVTFDHWHHPDWPEAALLTGSSGAIALRLSGGPAATHAITRVEVAAGLFSLVGTGQLSLGDLNRLTFDAQGDLSCARFLAHLPASGYRQRVQAYLAERGDSANDESVRLQLTVRAEAPRGTPLSFRWHLHAGCGLPEMTEAAD